MKMNEMYNIYVVQFIQRCLKVLSWQVNQFLRRLELSNTNVETAGNDLPIFMTPFAGNKIFKVVSSKFRYHHCCVSVIMRPAGYLKSLYVPHRAMSLKPLP